MKAGPTFFLSLAGAAFVMAVHQHPEDLYWYVATSALLPWLFKFIFDNEDKLR